LHNSRMQMTTHKRPQKSCHRSKLQINPQRPQTNWSPEKGLQHEHCGSLKTWHSPCFGTSWNLPNIQLLLCNWLFIFVAFNGYHILQDKSVSMFNL
jgi:hypothetical protein